MNELVYILRIVISCACGCIIGFERKNRSKEAGIRTHCLVACGAALMMVISKYGFFDLSADMESVRGADPARIAAQVVSGIGFLGAGMIFVHKNSISGLTTAAGIWTTAGIGMAIGAGMYVVGVVVTIIVVIVQTILHMNVGMLKTPIYKNVTIYDVTEPDYQKKAFELFKEYGITVHEMAIRKNGKKDKKTYRFVLEMPHSIREDEIISLIDYDVELK